MVFTLDNNFFIIRLRYQLFFGVDEDWTPDLLIILASVDRKANLK